MRPGTLEKIITPPSKDGIVIPPLNDNDDKDTAGIAADHTKDTKELRKLDEKEKFEQQQFSIKYQLENIRFFVKKVFIVFAVLYGFAIPATYLWNILMPGCLRWLSAEEVQAIKELAVTILTGVTVSVTISMMIGERENK